MNFFQNMCSCWSPPDAISYESISYPESSGSLVSGCRHQRPIEHVQTCSSPVVSHLTSSNPITRELYILRRGRERDFVHARESASFWRENLVTVFIVLRVLAGCRSGGNKLSNVRIVQMAYCRNPKRPWKLETGIIDEFEEAGKIQKFVFQLLSSLLPYHLPQVSLYNTSCALSRRRRHHCPV